MANNYHTRRRILTKSTSNPLPQSVVLKNNKTEQSNTAGLLCKSLFVVLSILVLVASVVITIIPLEYETYSCTSQAIPYDSVDNKVRISLKSKIGEGLFSGPESFVMMKDEYIITNSDGRLLSYNTTEKSLKTLLKASTCSEPPCNWPLGIRKINEFMVVVVDMELGMYLYNLESHAQTFLITRDTFIDGLPVFFLNDVVYAESSQVIYATQSSTRWDIRKNSNGFLQCDISGRIVYYDLNSHTIGALQTGPLALPNGIEISSDERFLIVSNSLKFQLLRIDLDDGSQNRLFAKVPGLPGNIRKTQVNTFLVALVVPTGQSFLSVDKLINSRLLRLTFAKVSKLTFLPRSWFDIPCDGFAAFAEFSHSGKLLRVFEADKDGKVSCISSVLQTSNGYVIGSFSHKVGYISLVKV